jgi:large subunit ribosomal protein L31
MKDNIGHPHYRPTKITCACGHVYDTFSTRGDFPVEICAKCHPFYTGQQRALDTAGRIDRFKKKYGNKATGVEVPAPAAPAAPATDDKTVPTK